MRSAKSRGRIVGMLLFLQLAGLIVPFVLLLPLTTGLENYLANAAGFSFQIRVAVFLLFANCALTIGIAIAALPVLGSLFGLNSVTIPVEAYAEPAYGLSQEGQ